MAELSKQVGGGGGGVPINSTLEIVVKDDIYIEESGATWLRANKIEPDPSVYPLAYNKTAYDLEYEYIANGKLSPVTLNSKLYIPSIDRIFRFNKGEKVAYEFLADGKTRTGRELVSPDYQIDMLRADGTYIYSLYAGAYARVSRFLISNLSYVNALITTANDNTWYHYSFEIHNGVLYMMDWYYTTPKVYLQQYNLTTGAKIGGYKALAFTAGIHGIVYVNGYFWVTNVPEKQITQLDPVTFVETGVSVSASESAGFYYGNLSVSKDGNIDVVGSYLGTLVEAAANPNTGKLIDSLVPAIIAPQAFDVIKWDYTNRTWWGAMAKNHSLPAVYTQYSEDFSRILNTVEVAKVGEYFQCFLPVGNKIYTFVTRADASAQSHLYFKIHSVDGTAVSTGTVKQFNQYVGQCFATFNGDHILIATRVNGVSYLMKVTLNGENTNSNQSLDSFYESYIYGIAYDSVSEDLWVTGQSYYVQHGDNGDLTIPHKLNATSAGKTELSIKDNLLLSHIQGSQELTAHYIKKGCGFFSDTPRLFMKVSD